MCSATAGQEGPALGHVDSSCTVAQEGSPGAQVLAESRGSSRCASLTQGAPESRGLPLRGRFSAGAPRSGPWAGRLRAGLSHVNKALCEQHRLLPVDLSWLSPSERRRRLTLALRPASGHMCLGARPCGLACGHSLWEVDMAQSLVSPRWALSLNSNGVSADLESQVSVKCRRDSP